MLAGGLIKTTAGHWQELQLARALQAALSKHTISELAAALSVDPCQGPVESEGREFAIPAITPAGNSQINTASSRQPFPLAPSPSLVDFLQ